MGCSRETSRFSDLFKRFKLAHTFGACHRTLAYLCLWEGPGQWKGSPSSRGTLRPQSQRAAGLIGTRALRIPDSAGEPGQSKSWPHRGVPGLARTWTSDGTAPRIRCRNPWLFPRNETPRGLGEPWPRGTVYAIPANCFPTRVAVGPFAQPNGGRAAIMRKHNTPESGAGKD